MPRTRLDDSTAPADSMASTTTSQRLPSTRPIDHRWDHSRGLVFAQAQRNFTWSSRSGIVFSAFPGQVRGYASQRSFKSDRPSQQEQAARQQSAAQQTRRPESMIDNPNRAPLIRPAARIDDVKRLGVEMDGLKKQLDQVRGRSDALAASVAELEELRRRDRDKLTQRDRDHEVALRKARQEERDVEHERMSAQVRAIKKQHDKYVVEAVEKAENEVRKQNEERLEKFKLIFKQKADSWTREHEEEIRALTQYRDKRRDERSTYDKYRKLYDTLGAALSFLSGHETTIENSYFAAAHKYDARDTYTRQMEHLDPWAKLKYPALLTKLDEVGQRQQQHSEQIAKDLKTLRLEQLDLTSTLNSLAHSSRMLTRYHRLEEQNEMTAADVAYWVANEKPFRERSVQIRNELRLRWQMEQHKGDSTSSQSTEEKDRLESILKTLDELSSLHFRVREVEALRALQTDSSVEKECFYRTLIPSVKIRQSAVEWNKVVRREPWADEDGEVSVSDQRTQRQAYMSTARQARQRLREFGDLVRKRALLQQMLRQVPQGREQEVDAAINDQLLIARGRERQAFVDLGLGRTRSFARQKAKSLSESNEPTRHVGRFARRVAAYAPSPRKIELSVRRVPSSEKAGEPRPETSEASYQIATLKRKVNRMHGSPARDEAKLEYVALRELMAKKELLTLETKNEALQQQASPNERTLRGLDDQITGSSLALTRMARDRMHAVRRRRRSVKSQSRTKIAEASTSTTDAPVLNMQPTAPKKAAHAFWPTDHRYFHEKIATHKPCSRENETAHASNPPVSVYCSMYIGQEQLTSRASPGIPGHAPSSFRDFRTALDQKLTASGIEDAVDDEKRPARPHETSSAEQDGADAMAAPETTPTASNEMEAGSTADQATARQSDELDPVPEVPLTYQIAPEDYRSAAMASRNSSAAYWSYKLYRNSDGKPPTVHYCKNYDQAEEQLQHFVGEPVLGFDIEWEPHFVKNRTPSAKTNVSLIQIASEGRICLVHVAMFPGTTPEQLVPPTLRGILESDQVIKAGVNIQGDAKRVGQWLEVTMRGQFELSHLYKVTSFAKKDISKSLKGAALDAQVQSVLLLPLKKGDVRVSSWSKSLLKEQADYSASDAYAGFRLFHALETKRKQMEPAPPRPAFCEFHEPLVLGDGTVLRPQPKKVHTPAAVEQAGEIDDEEVEQFFDAVEQQDPYGLSGAESVGVPLAGVDVTYPMLPTLDDASGAPAESVRPLADQASLAPSETTANEHSRPTSKRQPTLSMSPELLRANSWVLEWKASLPANYKCTVGNSSLRVYHMWHEQGYDINKVAELAREPPLARVTVASYILEVIRTESLPYAAARVTDALDLLPQSVHYRYRKITEKV